MIYTDDFNSLSPEELKVLAQEIVQEVAEQSEEFKTADFVIEDAWGEMSGDLTIFVLNKNLVTVPRGANWIASDSTDGPSCGPYGDVEYNNSECEDASKLFPKTLTIENYTVTLDVNDIDMKEFSDSEVENSEKENDGIGSYEYWGTAGYDEGTDYYINYGTVYCESEVSLSLYVSPSKEQEQE